MNNVYSKQGGSVSLFIVIFAALLIITISTAFIRLMIQDQSQATSNDLSKSALDSANAGVEDAKRAIVEFYKLDCPTAPVGNPRCDELKRNVALVGDTTPPNDGWTSGCKATVEAKVAVASPTGGEVLVKSTNPASGSEDEQLNQAYTCVKVQMNPFDYIGALQSNASRLIPLQTKDGVPFTQIKIQWYAQQNTTIDLDPDTVPYELPDQWPSNRPAILRAQLIQYKGDFQLSDFDNADYNSSLFLLPSSSPVAANTDTLKARFLSDIRRNTNSGAAQPVRCQNVSSTQRYACEVTIELPNWGDPLNANSRHAYLKLGQLYSAVNTDFRITMLTDSDDEVRFDDVQAVVDSTGRANDIFRRIQSRVDVGASSIPNVEAAVDVTKSLCKEFIVTPTTAMNPPDSACPIPPN